MTLWEVMMNSFVWITSPLAACILIALGIAVAILSVAFLGTHMLFDGPVWWQWLTLAALVGLVWFLICVAIWFDGYTNQVTAWP